MEIVRSTYRCRSCGPFYFYEKVPGDVPTCCPRCDDPYFDASNLFWSPTTNSPGKYRPSANVWEGTVITSRGTGSEWNY